MINLVHTTSTDDDFRTLIVLLDQGLNERNGVVQSNYDKYNVIPPIGTVVIAKMGDQPVGCGCFKKFDAETVEIKRMFVKPEHRGAGVATKMLAELEAWARDLGFRKTVLETGKNQVEAIALYTKSGYERVPNFGQYAGMEFSLCFGKKLRD